MIKNKTISDWSVFCPHCEQEQICCPYTQCYKEPYACENKGCKKEFLVSGQVKETFYTCEALEETKQAAL